MAKGCVPLTGDEMKNCIAPVGGGVNGGGTGGGDMPKTGSVGVDASASSPPPQPVNRVAPATALNCFRKWRRDG